MFCLVASAHAGMFDSFLENMVSCRAMLIVIAIVHTALWLIIKLKATSNNKVVANYKAIFRNIIKWLYKNVYIRIPVAWIFSSMALGIYLDLLAEQIFFYGLLLILIVWILYTVIVIRKKWRRRFLTGYRAIYYYGQAIILQLIGIITYYVICDFPWFKDVFSYADDQGFEDLVYMIEPKPLDILYLTKVVFVVGILFGISFFLNLICLIVKRGIGLCKTFSKAKK